MSTLDIDRITGNEALADLNERRRLRRRLLLTRGALSLFIGRFLRGELTASQLQELGDLFEGESTDFEDDSENRVLAQVVFEIATPEANGRIDSEAASRWVAMLQSR